MPQLDISTYSSQVFWLVVCFSTMCVVMATLVAPRIGLSLHHRAYILQEHTMTAEKLLEQAKILREKSNQTLNQACQEASQQVHQVVHELIDYRTEKIQELDQKLHLDLLDLPKSLFLEKQETLKQSQDLVIELVRIIFQKMTDKDVPIEKIKKALETSQRELL